MANPNFLMHLSHEWLVHDLGVVEIYLASFTERSMPISQPDVYSDFSIPDLSFGVQDQVASPQKDQTKMKSAKKAVVKKPVKKAVKKTIVKKPVKKAVKKAPKKTIVKKPVKKSPVKKAPKKTIVKKPVKAPTKTVKKTVKKTLTKQAVVEQTSSFDPLYS
jgi:ParB-like chromosome segregation protein Spo0J